MSYVDRSQVEAKLPPQFLLQALDDDGDGLEDEGVWDAIAAEADEAVEGFLEGRYAIPFAEGSVPRIVSNAAKLFALETLYMRRGYSKDTDPPNPWAAAATAMRARLARIGAGEEPLHPDTGVGGAPGDTVVVVTEPSRTTSSSGRMGY
jgi:hypothetical protein